MVYSSAFGGTWFGQLELLVLVPVRKNQTRTGSELEPI
jgi:hypothetical protein